MGLILADQSRLTGSRPAHERWIWEIRRRNSKGSFLSAACYGQPSEASIRNYAE